MVKIDNELYQWIYDNVPEYGRAESNHCPGIRVYPHYKDWLYPTTLIDLGSGTGQTVEFFRKKGIDAYGIDYIKSDYIYCKSGDITRTMKLGKYKIATSFDVIEHLNNAQVTGLFLNMIQCERQIFTIANTPSIIEKDGEKIDLHINIKSFDNWRGIISDYFDIVQEIEIRDYQHLYCCQKKQGDKTLIKYLENKGYKVARNDITAKCGSI